MLIVKDAPGVSVFGKVNPLTLYIFAKTSLTQVKATLVEPVFLMVTAMLLLLPTSTFPKLAEDELNESVPVACAELVVIAAHTSSAQTNAARATSFTAIAAQNEAWGPWSVITIPGYRLAFACSIGHPQGIRTGFTMPVRAGWLLLARTGYPLLTVCSR